MAGTVVDMQLVTLAAIEAARDLVAPVIRHTTVDRCESLSRIAQRPVLLKHEERQRTGSFKIRGAYNHIARYLSGAHFGTRPTGAAAEVVAASAGNHAQGVALAASLLGVRSTIFMPATAPLPKIEATRDYGATIELIDTGFDGALDAALAHANASDSHFVSPFEDSDVIAGQGTLGLELAAQAEDAEVVVVPVGGGGLVSGIAVAMRALRPSCRIVGVEAEGAASMTAALAAGRPVALDRLDTMADGISNKRVGELTLAHTQALVDDVVTVTEEDISHALLLLAERAKVVVEPAGATPLAALLSGKVAGNGPACLVLSGGNVDPTVLVQVLRHGLSAAGRYLALRFTIHDRPGELHRLLGSIARRGLNVIDVEHHRTGPGLGVDEVEVRLTLETRDPAHRDEVLGYLRGDGYNATAV